MKPNEIHTQYDIAKPMPDMDYIRNKATNHLGKTMLSRLIQIRSIYEIKVEIIYGISRQLIVDIKYEDFKEGLSIAAVEASKVLIENPYPYYTFTVFRDGKYYLSQGSANLNAAHNLTLKRFNILEKPPRRIQVS